MQVDIVIVFSEKRQGVFIRIGAFIRINMVCVLDAKENLYTIIVFV